MSDHRFATFTVALGDPKTGPFPQYKWKKHGHFIYAILLLKNAIIFNATLLLKNAIIFNATLLSKNEFNKNTNESMKYNNI